MAGGAVLDPSVERLLGDVLARLAALERGQAAAATKLDAVHDQTMRWRGGIRFAVGLSVALSAVISAIIASLKGT